MAKRAETRIPVKKKKRKFVEVLHGEACLSLAMEQDGLLTREQLVGLGLSSSEISEGRRAGLLKRMGPGVFARTRSQDVWRRSLRFVALWLPDAVVSHEAAALLHGLDGVDTAPIEVVVASWRESRRGVKVHRGELAAEDIADVNGFRVTTVTRTLLDVAGRLSEERLSWAVEHAWRRGDTTPQELRLLLESRRGRGMEGVAQLDAVLKDCEQRLRPLESALEVRMWRALRDDGVTPEPQCTVCDSEGELRIDFAFLHERVALETLGKKSHDGDANLERDSRRTLRLSAIGWSVVPVTWEMLEHDTRRVLRQIRDSLRTHDPRLTRRGFKAGQLGLPKHYLIRPRPQFPEPLTPTAPAIAVVPTPRRPTFRPSDDGLDDRVDGLASQ